ncbi:MAG: GAF domain-containing protein [Microcoleus sp.]
MSPCHIEFLESLQVRANLVVPITKGDELWGLLVVHHCTAPREWQASEIELLRQLSAQVSIAIQQADLFEQLQAELRERQLAQIALQTLNAELEQRVIERTAELTEVNDRLLVTLLEKEHAYQRLEEQAQLLDLARDSIITWDLNSVITF